MIVSNTFWIKFDLSWFNIVSSIISVVTILFGSRWTVRPIQEETNAFVAYIVFLPLFIFRMLSWLAIITILHSFSLIAFTALAFINILIFVLAQDQLVVEPLSHSLLSLIFPVSFFPSTRLSNKNGLKLLFWLTLIGNLTLLTVIASLFALYDVDLYNPWCSANNNNNNDNNNKLLIPEQLMNSFHYPVIALFALATIPVGVSFAIKSIRLYFQIS
jgi:hypothetical protein